MNAAISRSFRTLLLIVPVVLLAAGCSNMPAFSLSGARFHESFEVDLDRPTAHRACREALERMGFLYKKGSPGSEELEMVTRVLPGSVAQPVRQRRALVAVSAGTAGGTLVQIGFWEDSEQESGADAVASAGRMIRGGLLYETFWVELDALVAARRTASPETPAPPAE